eukprot:COSAG04_NODE_30456_length_262_cov_1.263804_1_plen_45_part_10
MSLDVGRAGDVAQLSAPVEAPPAIAKAGKSKSKGALAQGSVVPRW